MDRAQMLTTIADQAPALVTVYDTQTGQYLFVNQSVTRILGYRPEDFIKGGFDFALSLVHADDLEVVAKQNNLALKNAKAQANLNVDNEPIASFEYRMKHKDGSWKWLRTEASVFSRDNNGQVISIMNISLNITDRKTKEEQLALLQRDFERKLAKQTKELKQRENMYRSLIEVVEEYAIFHLDPEGFVTSWNEGIGKILGYSAEEIIGLPMSIFFTADDQKANQHVKELELARTQGTVVRNGLRVRKDGTTFYAVATTTPIWDENGKLEGFSKIMRDITELKEAEETIRYHALHDTLTGLPNRKALDANFNISKSLAIRNGHKIGLIFLDLDRFKNINDTLGHGIGDLVLKEISRRLRNSIRSIDAVARLGGDEFILLINEVHSASSLKKVAQKIVNAITPAMLVQGHTLHVTASMGIAMFPNNGQDIYTLLKNADTAMYRAKDLGRSQFQFYDYSMNMQSSSRLSLEQDLRTALANREFEMHYQPFTEIATGKILGVESLVRWNHPRLGPILPTEFIPLAEETGMIIPIGKWILNQVCTEAKQFQHQDKQLPVTVNLSARQFAEAALVKVISDILNTTGLKPEHLEIEVTESVAMDNITRTNAKLKELKSLGIGVTIDDFGTGYSSLSYLKGFPVQKLKIDKSFIQHAISDDQDKAIIKAVVSMGHSLGLSVCAEGVETEEQLSLLWEMECDIAQGYLISRPLPAKALMNWLANL